ncbi:MAG TPA: hypothetical protein VK048_03515 [Atopostipes sp.]|nr:hypothetical protein [Atopostipes sp.]
MLNNFITVRYETIPGQLTTNEIKDYLNLHINQTIRIPLENPVFDFEVVEKSEDEQRIFIVAYPGGLIHQY